MSSENPDPEEDNITGLTPGGSVQPGDTPPAEGSTGAPQGHEEHGPKKGFSAVWLVLIGLVVALVLVLIVGQISSLF